MAALTYDEVTQRVHAIEQDIARAKRLLEKGKRAAAGRLQADLARRLRNIGRLKIWTEDQS